MTPYALRTEYLTNPLGLDKAQPRLFWKLRSDRAGARPVAYRVQVSSQPGGPPDLWDSGRVEAAEAIGIPYAGSPLGVGQRAYWTVEVWDENGTSLRSEEAWWETGQMGSSWDAQWIGGDVVGARQATSPVAHLRKEFSLPAKPVRARLYATALGLYEAYLNGNRVGEDIFTPGWTDYRTRVLYQAYDVTPLLQEGENALGVLLGDGWYCGHVGMDGRQVYGDRPRFLGRLVVECADGSSQVLTSDGSWSVAYGPMAESDLLMGESYDFRRLMPGWNQAGYKAEGWRPVTLFEDPGISIDPTIHPTVRVTEELKPVDEPRTINGWPAPRYIFDFGQNLVGRVRVRLVGKAGKTARIKYAEVLDKDKNLYTESLRTARATDYVTFAQDGEVWYEPTFTFHGFRYMEITGVDQAPTAADATAVVLGSDTPRTGDFECDDPLVNQLYQNIVWGQRGNFLEVPTDCPQRDERLGWTGDAQVFIRTACHNMDVASFFTKWQLDIEDSQGENGAVPAVIPCPDLFGGDGGPAWADAAVICPWTIHLCYGDVQLLRDRYDSMKAFVDFLWSQSKEGIRAYEGYSGFRGFGDWLNTGGDTPKDLIGTAFLAYSSGLLSKIAALVGRQEDAQTYAQKREEAKRSFQRRFVTAEGLVAGHTQTAYVLALHFDLLEEGQRPEALQALVNDIGRRGWKLSTGFVGTPYLQHVLTRFGRNDVAYRLLFQKAWPSWLYPVTQGATTIWERWDGWTDDKGFQTPAMNSFNHYAYGAVGDWLVAQVAGLDVDPEAPGYRRIRFAPHPGEGLNRAKATLDTVRGPAEAGWTIEGGRFRYEILVPPGATGIVQLPDGCDDRGPFEVGSGRHVYERSYVPSSGEATFAAGGASAPV